MEALMTLRATVASCFLLILPSVSYAQAAPAEEGPGAAGPMNADSSDMVQPMAGDHWTYEVRDEITGTLKNPSTETITDVTATEISMRTEIVGGGAPAYFVYDYLWNMKSSPAWKYAPNDGTGVKPSLKVGNAWTAQNTALFGGRSATERRSISSKVVGEETITTAAGTFQTFKIETQVTATNINDPTKKSKGMITSWYAPSIDHWAKRTMKFEANGHVAQNISVALVDCGRR